MAETLKCPDAIGRNITRSVGAPLPRLLFARTPACATGCEMRDRNAGCASEWETCESLVSHRNQCGIECILSVRGGWRHTIYLSEDAGGFAIRSLLLRTPRVMTDTHSSWDCDMGSRGGNFPSETRHVRELAHYLREPTSAVLLRDARSGFGPRNPDCEARVLHMNLSDRICSNRYHKD